MSSGGNASLVSSQCVVRGQYAVRGQCIVRECGVMRGQEAMRRQGMCRHNALSGGSGVIANLSSQCIIIVSAKSHTQAAGALYIYKKYNILYYIKHVSYFIYIYII